ncbi:PIN domain-containing protein [Rugamonas apoptosis]|uniref:Ribonuclease VapC n=1 Tax=Rugamonas apoptosis TaxID=2758570 RepID=A0A7W2FCD2_9BURK|nr:PIN domain-containing protein [Rugamonas apoptosis]MBA5689143.1 PIN domain-containing protein [Rugamonas apoptosis]
MALILFDTNIFIDLLNGVHQASIELSSYDHPAISYITYMELRCGEYSRPQDKAVLDALLAEFKVFSMTPLIMETAIQIRGRSLVTKPSIKLPDAIIGATARSHALALVTRNGKDFASAGVTVHTPYDYDFTTGSVTNIRPTYSPGIRTIVRRKDWRR